MSRMRRSMLAAFGILMFAAPGFAQRPEEIVRWRAVGPAAAVKPGATLDIELSAEIEPGWRLYAMSQPQGGPRPLVIGIPSGRPFAVKVKDIVAPVPSVSADPNFNVDTQYYADSLAITVPVAASRTVARGTYALPIEVTFQACSSRICLRPFTHTLTVTVRIVAGPQGGGR